MVTKKKLLGIVLIVILNTLNAQENNSIANTKTSIIRLADQLQNDTFYVGVDGRFVLSFANDSIIQARFFRVDRYDRYQKIPYRRSGDTIYLHNSSQTRLPYSFCTKKQKGTKGEKGRPVIVKFFHHKLSMAGGYELLSEKIFYMDTISYQLYIPYKEVFDCPYSEIIMVYLVGCYARLCKDADKSLYTPYDYLQIDMSNFYALSQHALFNEFPIVVKGDSIFPVDNEKNYQCWIDNGFYFPVMVKGCGKPKKAKDILFRHAGLEGTKFEF